MGLVAYSCGCTGSGDSCTVHNRKIVAHEANKRTKCMVDRASVFVNSTNSFPESKTKGRFTIAFLAQEDSVESYKISRFMLHKYGFAVAICEPTKVQKTIENATAAGFDLHTIVSGTLVTDQEFSSKEREEANHFLADSCPFDEFHQMSIVFFEKCPYAPKAVYLGNSCLFESFLMRGQPDVCAINSTSTRPLKAAQNTNSRMLFTTMFDFDLDNLDQTEEPFNRHTGSKHGKNNSPRIRRK